MAIKITVSLPLAVISVVIISLLLSSQSCAAAAAAPNETGKSLIAKTCSQTEFPDICTSTLESDPRSLNADLRGLSRIGLELVVAKGSETARLTFKLMNEAHGYAKWSPKSACFRLYNISINRIKDEGLKNVDGGKYQQAYQVLNYANGEISYCNTLAVPEITERNTMILKFISDVKTILRLLF